MIKGNLKVFFFCIILLVAVTVGLWAYLNYSRVNQINSFEACSQHGYPVRESYPATCATPDGRTFTQKVEDSDTTLEGEIVCLPHKDTSGPVTLECAFGLKDSSGNYYALEDETAKFMQDMIVNKKVKVTGTLSNSSDSNYAIIGSLKIETLTSLE